MTTEQTYRERFEESESKLRLRINEIVNKNLPIKEIDEVLK